jgi:hypothetical protein
MSQTTTPTPRQPEKQPGAEEPAPAADAKATQIVAEEQKRAERYLPTAELFIGLSAMALRPTARRIADEPVTPFEQVQLALSTYFLARLVAREKLGSVVRAPILTAAENEDGDSRTHFSSSFADLVTCTRCVGVWAAAGLILTRAWAPRTARVMLPMMSAAGVNNLLQATHAVLARCSNEGIGAVVGDGGAGHSATPEARDRRLG